MKTQDNTAERTLTISKKIQAPIEKVWAAWTKPEHIAQWWGPKGMTLNIEKHDFTVGGQWRYTIEMPDGNVFVSDGTYADIIPNEKLTTTADFKPMTVGVVLKVLFRKDKENTQFDFHVLHPTIAYCEQQKNMGFNKGWDAAFDRLEKFVAE